MGAAKCKTRSRSIGRKEEYKMLSSCREPAISVYCSTVIFAAKVVTLSAGFTIFMCLHDEM
jgi:hypothetical protein